MHYEINATQWKDGKQVHFFATHARSATTEAEAKVLADAIRAMPEVASVTVTLYRTVGTRTSI